jgi:hypothetical protein
MTRLTPGNIWLACLTTLAALLALAGSDAWWSWLIAFAIGVGPWFAAAKLLDERAASEEENGRLRRELKAKEEATVPVPLRIVRSPIPMQRRGDEWDRIVQAIEGES